MKDFKGKHLLAIDYGRKFTGLASYKWGNDPYPIGYGRIRYESDTNLLEKLNVIIEDEFIDVLIIRIPYYTDGKESEMTKIVLDFATELEKKFPQLEIYQQDEALTTYAAEERMKSSPQFEFRVDLKRIDEVAALIMLEEFVSLNKS